MSTLLDWLLPRSCLACSAALPGAGRASARMGLCLRCEERLRRIDRAPVCALCAEAIAGGRLCAACALSPPPWRRLFALWEYAPPLREVVHAFKFRRLDYLGRPLGERLGRWIRERSASPPLTEPRPVASDCGGLPELVVPMPLAWPRRLGRGFNQAESLARAVAGELGRPLHRALRRRTALAHQTGRSRRERLRRDGGHGSGGAAHPAELREALQDAFRTVPFRPVAGRRLLLVDDVLTTGATARGAAAALLAAGARSVDLAVVARTPSRASGSPGGRADLSIDTPLTAGLY